MTEKGMTYLRGEARRAFDVATASTLLTAGAIPTVAIAGVTARDHGVRGLFFRQARHWPRDPNFHVTKFRTIPTGADERVVAVEDTRATRLGNVFRRTGLDEIPQLLSVARGTMTLIGIRPIVDDDMQQRHDADPVLFDEWYDVYQQLRPAFSSVGGLWYHQHDAVHDVTTVNQTLMRRDLAYVDQASLGHDMRILSQMAGASLSMLAQRLTS